MYRPRRGTHHGSSMDSAESTDEAYHFSEVVEEVVELSKQEKNKDPAEEPDPIYLALKKSSCMRPAQQPIPSTSVASVSKRSNSDISYGHMDYAGALPHT